MFAAITFVETLTFDHLLVLAFMLSFGSFIGSCRRSPVIYGPEIS
jgi:hypothetical protein